jgi:hypothetical protein
MKRLLEERALVAVMFAVRGDFQVELFHRRCERLVIAGEIRRNGVVEQKQLLSHHFRLETSDDGLDVVRCR